MMFKSFLVGRRRRSRSFLYRPAVWMLEDRSLPSFLGPASYAVPGGAIRVVVGDFNGDGVPDLAVTSSGAVINILLGRGDGTFRDAVSYDAGSSPDAIVVGDFNGDGVPDLAVTNFSATDTGTVSILLGNGDGSFRAPVSYASGQSQSDLVTGDFNGDGILDLAVVNQDGVYPDYRGTLRVLLGNGDGSFQPPVTYAAGIIPRFLVEGDFNGDGIPDLAVANLGITTAGTGSSISVFRGNGDGTFQPAVDYAPGLRARSLAVGDLTGNGLPDLLVGRDGSNLVTVLRNRGDGTFEAAGDYPTAGSFPSAIAVGDFTGDGIPDLAVASILQDTLSVLPGNGDGTFGAPVSYAAGASSGIAVADFNGDGALDIAMNTAPLINYSLSVFLNRGDGTFQASVEMNPGTGPVVSGDFNGDGITDLVAPNFDNPGTVSVLLGNGDGTFQPPVRYGVGPEPEAVVVGDFNGDGIPDLAVADTNGPSGPDGMVSILLGRGDGTFLPSVDYTVGGGPRALVVGDFNGDGVPDLAVESGTMISVLLGRGDGTFAPAIATANGPILLSLAAGDFNGDGLTDLVVVNQGSRPDYISTVSVLLSNGDGTFQAPITYTAAARSGFVTVADFNGDGIPDLAVANSTSGTVGIWLGNGDGTFQPPVNYVASPYALFVAVADFNGDGIPDLAVAGTNAISILLGHGDGTFGTALSYFGGDVPSPLVVEDFNGDGLPDLLARNQGGLIVLFNAGDWDPGAPAIRSKPPILARSHAHLTAPSPWSVGLLAAPLTAGDPQAFLQGSATARAPRPNSLPQALGNQDRPIQLQILSIPISIGAVRPMEDTGFSGWADAVIDWLGTGYDGSKLPPAVAPDYGSVIGDGYYW